MILRILLLSALTCLLSAPVASAGGGARKDLCHGIPGPDKSFDFQNYNCSLLLGTGTFTAVIKSLKGRASKMSFECNRATEVHAKHADYTCSDTPDKKYTFSYTYYKDDEKLNVCKFFINKRVMLGR